MTETTAPPARTTFVEVISSAPAGNNNSNIQQQRSHSDVIVDGDYSYTTYTYSVWAVGLCFSVPALGGALFGWDIGATSFVIAQLMKQDDDGNNNNNNNSSNNSRHASWTDRVAATPSLAGFLVATASLGAFLGSLFIMLLLQQPAKKFHLGRRQELRIGALLYAVGTLLQVIAGSAALQFWTGLGLFCFFLGRLIYGLAIGIVMHAAPTYLAEQMPSSIRGLVVSGKEAAIVLGILLGNVAGDWFYSPDHHSTRWIYAYACSWFLSGTMFVLSYAIPRSCRWLLSQGRDREALASLQFVYKSHEVALLELQTIQQALREQEELLLTTQAQDNEMGDYHAMVSVLLSSLSFLWDPRYRAPLIAGVGLVVLQQITGQPSVLSYATPIFQQAGLSKDSTVLVAIFKLLTTLAAAGTVEKWGRKPLLYVGCSFMLVALVVLTCTIGQVANLDYRRDSSDESGASSTTTTTTTTSQQQQPLVNTMILLSMFLYIGGYQFSFGPISWLMISEVFPLSVRGQAVAFAVQMNFFWNAIVQFGVPILSSSVGLGVTFGVFAVLTAYSIYFVRVRVPETKGLTLEQIEEQFREMGAAVRSGQGQWNDATDTEVLLENVDHDALKEPPNDDELPE